MLESVERGERLARYSFLGFGDAIDVRMTEDALTVGAARFPRPSDQAEYLATLRQALSNAPRLKPEVPDLPFGGGVGGCVGL